MSSTRAHTATIVATSAFVLLTAVMLPVSFVSEMRIHPPAIAVASAATDTGSGSQTPLGKGVSEYDVTCSINPYYFSASGCFNVLLSWMGSIFIALGGMVLRLAGMLFNILITHVVIDFKGTLDAMGATDAIKTGWTVFRDFSNILIIGIFTFIAVSIILGLKEFGQKKLIANVLIVAVLINFSLLFTKTIIDASNFTAYVIYKQIAGQSQNTFDISQAFLSPMKITSLWNDKGNMTDDILRSSGSGAQALMFGLVGGLLLFAVAVVLFYGCFLVAARAVLLIFLMLTAALAFATYLLPTLQNSSYGWSEWWKSLINTAVFAPLIMLFLAISLSIVTAARSKVPASATLGDFIAAPQTQTAGSGWTIVLLYIIGIGTLFVSLRAASSFAGKISGFNIAGAMTSLPFAAALRGISPIMQRMPVVGARASMRRSMKLDKEIKKESVTAAKTGNYDTVLQLMKKKAAADKAAKRTYNVLDTGFGKSLGAALNVPKRLLDGTHENYAEKANRIATEAAKTGAGAVLSKTEAEKHVRDEVEKTRDTEYTELKNRQQASEKLLKAAQQMEHTAKEAAGINRERAEQDRVIAEANRQSVEITKRKQAGDISEVEHQKLMREQKEKIEQANTKLRDIKRKETQIGEMHNIPNLQAERDQANVNLNKFMKEVETEVKERSKDLLIKSEEIGKSIAAHEGKHHGDSTIAEIARTKLGGRIKNRDVLEKRKLQKEVDNELDGGKK